MKFMGLIEQLFAQFGYWVLLIGLPLDAIALPIPPGNTTMTYTGFLSYKGVLNWFLAMVAAWIGTMIGMTITYWIGYRLGTPLIERYGKLLFLKPAHLQKSKEYYAKYGNKLLLFSYFIPGIRQFIFYFVGIIRVPYRIFALYAFIGSALWVVVFFGIGYLFGDQWLIIFLWVEKFLIYTLIGLCIAVAIFLLLKWRSRLKTGLQKPQR
ncbi:MULTISPECIES: DedA family protein [unclassified Paenibacillus]|uniref:DedA family protein n=1 Tax=unclassified Paenibacillus TaxID=185978 RepID=UPI00278398FE|nr:MULTISPECIES: DedA family protein [unclassified Paenibacillus]MDQ0903615.1 membrane protein DedA with SNARE-associated domain [Paenibacillus sp. V4I7]MDQ0917910.1 membrane protein DedA with SNARE-associated domain [Paenibacillus sp. V4I5]